MEENKINTDIGDEALVEKARKGDKEAFTKIVERYEKKIYNLAFRISGNAEDASDILQETFMQLLKKIDTFKGESKFSTWLYRIATNTALMKKRKDKKRPSVSIDKPLLTSRGSEITRQLKDDWAENPIDIVENKELKKVLNKAIDSMHPEYRIPLILRDINGLSNEEVSNILDVSVAAVKSRVHRARLYLRSELSGYFKEKR
ncbi:MAG: sigma-70 family RNA polymerase sigma factor [Elusimicrobia bacterium]|nr:sigma-70 family RNA polymerase sigma factor [Elusimicrobiota bacterium]